MNEKRGETETYNIGEKIQLDSIEARTISNARLIHLSVTDQEINLR